MARRAANVYAVYGRQGGRIGGAARMALLSKARRSELASAAARKRWGNERIKALAAEPPAVVIKHMLDAIEKTGGTHYLFVIGAKTLHFDVRVARDYKFFRDWESITKRREEALREQARTGRRVIVPDEPAEKLVGTFGPGWTLSMVMDNLLRTPT